MQNFRYIITALLSTAVLCPQAYAMKRFLNARTVHQVAARRYVSSGAMDINQAFRVLGFSSGASLKQVRAKYHELLKAHHPDITGNAADNEKIRKIKEAYKLIKEYLENRPQPNPTGAQQGYQQQSSRSSYGNQNTYNTHNQQQYGQSRHNHTSSNRQRYQEDWSSSSSSSLAPYVIVGGIGLLIAYSVIRNKAKEERRRQKRAHEKRTKKEKERRREREYRKTLNGSIAAGDKEQVKKLIKNGASLYKRTPLAKAVHSGDKEMVKLLLDAGAQVNYTEWIPALATAAYDGNKEMVKLLLDAGAQVDIHNRNSITPLACASCGGYTDIMKMLLDAGANVNMYTGRGTPLAYAASEGHEEAVKILLDAGANVNALDAYGRTPLDRAIDYEKEGLVKVLRAAGGKFMSEL